jgi:predicted amidohydrolase
LVERDGGRLFNTLLLFDERGTRIGRWRKRHPWIPERWASPGGLGSPVVAWRGLRITAAICFDVHFLDEAARELDEADLLLFPSAWVEEGPDTRVPLLQARARRHGGWIANANWGRGIPELPGQGGSVIVGPDGTVRARAGEGEEPLAAELESDPP